jgi:hypothetical protein
MKTSSQTAYVQSPYVAYSQAVLKHVSVKNYLAALKGFSTQSSPDAFLSLEETLNNNDSHHCTTAKDLFLLNDVGTVPEKWCHALNRQKEAAWFLLFKAIATVCPPLLRLFQSPLEKIDPGAQRIGSPLIPTRRTQALLKQGLNSFIENSMENTRSIELLQLLCVLQPEQIQNAELQNIFLLNERLGRIPEKELYDFTRPILEGAYGLQERQRAREQIGTILTTIEQRYQRNQFREPSTNDFAEDTVALALDITNEGPRERQCIIKMQPHQNLYSLYHSLSEATEWQQAFYTLLTREPNLLLLSTGQAQESVNTPTSFKDFFESVEVNLPESHVRQQTLTSFEMYLQAQNEGLSGECQVKTTTAISMFLHWMDTLREGEPERPVNKSL